MQTIDAFPRSAVQTRLGPVAVRRSGKSGKHLFLLHGIGGNADAWRKQYEAFGERYRVAGWDAPGYGGSFDFSVESPSVEDYADAFVALMDAMGVERAHLVGHSLGGLVAASVAANHAARVDRLVLTACSSGHATYDEARRQQVLRTRLDAFASGDVRDYARSRVANLLSASAPADVVEEAVRVMAQIRQPGFPQATRMVSASDIFPDLARIQAPTRVVSGSVDGVTPPELNRRIAAAVKGADYVGVEGAGHWLLLEHPGPFNAAVLGFLD